MKPIAWYDPTNGAVSADKDSPLFTSLGQVLPLYPEGEWVGLTELERAEICDLKWRDWEDSFDIEGFARAIEQRLKEKNT
jgi:hypothetical protein